MVVQNQCPARQTGFTLLELVVAITLMGLLLVVLYSGLRLGLNSWDRGEQHAETTNRSRLVHELLRRQLTQSIAAYYLGEQQQRLVAFTGQAEYIEFIAPMLDQLGQGGLYRVRIGAVDNQLRLRWQPYMPNDADAEAEAQRETVLLDKVSEVEWAYFGVETASPETPAEWRGTWGDTTQRPQLVRLNLHLHGQAWPDLVVALADGKLL